jgi:hypothetical protein
MGERFNPQEALSEHAHSEHGGPVRGAPQLAALSEGRVSRTRSRGCWGLLPILAVALVFHLWGIERDLPYVTDDPTFVDAAVTIAASNNLNPRWFGHPGSTVIYPLAFAYRVWDTARYDGSLVHGDANLKATVRNHGAEFHLLGRLLTVVYAVLSIPLVYLIGRCAFTEQVAVAAALLSAVYPTAVFDKVVRTDGASLFFGLLGLWLCLRLFERPSVRNQLLAGVAIGLAIGTKYPLGTLVAVLVAVDAAIVWSLRSCAGMVQPALLGCAVGFAGVALGFAGSTPYFFLDHAAALRTLNVELRTTHVGADGLAPLGNLSWYLSAALPAAISWAQMVPAAVGVARAGVTRRSQQLLLLVFVAVFLAGISLHALHWGRWLIPILPVFALFAASGLEWVSERFLKRLGLPRAVPHVFACVAGLVALPSTYRVMQLDRLHTSPSTAVLAQQWIEEHLPADSHLAFEAGTLPLPLQSERINLGVFRNTTGGRNFIEMGMVKLATRGSLEYYARLGYRYLVTTNEYYEYYPANRHLYTAEAAFYEALLTRGRLLHEIRPSTMHQGATIRIYQIQ